GVAGMIDREQGLVRSAPTLGWRDVPFIKLLQARTPRTPLWIASELSVSAWGERAVGGGRGVNDLIVVLVGSNIGAGIVMAGKLYEGASGAAGELGHVQVMPNGRLCSCGQRGCLEAYAGGQNLAAWARDDLRIAMAAARAAAHDARSDRRHRRARHQVLAGGGAHLRPGARRAGRRRRRCPSRPRISLCRCLRAARGAFNPG